jgi:predicted dehydrogenase
MEPSTPALPSSPPPDASRREFVRLAVSLAALPVVAGCQASRPAQSFSVPAEPVPASRNLRIALIGCGGRGTGAAVQALRADPNTTLVAMSDLFEDRLSGSLQAITAQMGEAAPDRVQVPAERRYVGFDSYHRAIADADVVLLTSYPHFRPAHLRAAVNAGRHVFAEKPLAVDAPGARSILESASIAHDRGLALVVGFCWRYNDGMRATFDRLNGGWIGDITTVHSTYHTTTLSKRPRKPAWSDMEFQMRNWWHFTWISGDHIVEQAVHSIDRLSWAMGDRLPARVTCLGGRAARSGPEHGDVFDHFAAVYEYDDGRRCFHTCRQIDRCPSDNTDYIFGTKGTATVNGWVPTYSITTRAGKPVWKYGGPPIRDMYQVEHDELFASIRAGRAINDGRRGAESTLMAIMARMAAYTGQTISWDQALNSTESLGPSSYAFGPLPTPSVPVPGVTRFS